MANNRVQKMLWWREATAGAIPTNPKCYAFKAETFGVNATQNTEAVKELGAGRGASKQTYGFTTISGDLGIVWNTDNAPILCTHGIGEATSVTAATTDTWATGTVIAKGDIINHSDTKHSLVCVIGGTTGATEPDLAAYITPAAGRGIQVTDGTVTWVIMPKLYEYIGARGDCLASFGIEVEDGTTCGTPTSEYNRKTGLYINTLPISLAGSNISLKSTVNTIGMAEEDSVIVTGNGGTYVAMKDKAGFTETELISDYYSFDSHTLLINGVAPTAVTSFDMTINNGVTVDEALNNSKILNLDVVVVEGTINALFDTAKYLAAYNHTTQSAKITFTKANGCLVEFEFPQFEMAKTSKMYSTDKSTMLEIPASAFDTSGTKSVKWRCIAPLATY